LNNPCRISICRIRAEPTIVVKSAQWAGTEEGSGELNFGRPGKTTDHQLIESFMLRVECLDQHRFTAIEEAEAMIGEWREGYSRFSCNGLASCGRMISSGTEIIADAERG
jgi:Integrase core domain